MIVWGGFISTVGAYLDSTVSKEEKDTAKIIADSYALAVQTAMILQIPGSSIVSSPAALTAWRIISAASAEFHRARA